ncbi:hypothetical protein BN1013_00127 [Candidatus Rubidus massiliensis]|nr:MAG: hypothetical protein BGO10_07585 [Chlamydia sp. 32-24]CDZ79631.1 hypothetical protein BN1013_00127 [Candidatus Rubidus massiliensis]
MEITLAKTVFKIENDNKANNKSLSEEKSSDNKIHQAFYDCLKQYASYQKEINESYSRADDPTKYRDPFIN